MTEVIRDLDKLYQLVYLNRRSKLSPREMASNLDDILIKKAKSELEDKCAREGFVRKGSVQMIRRSLGSMNEDQFTGDIHYHLLLSAQVCNPSAGMTLRAMVYENDKIGILATFGPLQILLPREVHQRKEIFGKVKRGDFIEAVILGKKFKLDDKKIFCFAIWSEDTKALQHMLNGVPLPPSRTDVSSTNDEDEEIVVKPSLPDDDEVEIEVEEGEETEEDEATDEEDEEDDDDDDEDEEEEDEDDDIE